MTPQASLLKQADGGEGPNGAGGPKAVAGPVVEGPLYRLGQGEDPQHAREGQLPTGVEQLPGPDQQEDQGGQGQGVDRMALTSQEHLAEDPADDACPQGGVAGAAVLLVTFLCSFWFWGARA